MTPSSHRSPCSLLSLPPLRRALALWGCWLMCSAWVPAHAEQGDRFKPMNLAADRQGTLDMAKKVVVFTGNVVITKGTILIEADRVEVRDLPNGSRLAVAFGSADKQATFRQKRDKPNEFVWGRADRLEYDEKSDTVRFISRAVARRLLGDKVADEITGNLLVYNNGAEFFSASAAQGPQGAASASGNGRVSVTLAPRETEAAASAASAASSPEGNKR